jgi:capsular exopolysaccharide synthesis family protein
MLAVLAAVAVLTYFWPPSYESTALILVEPRGEDGGSSSLEILERLGQVSRVETEIELIKSRPVIEQAVDELDLHVVVEASAGSAERAGEFESLTAGPDAVPGTYDLEWNAGDRPLISERTTGHRVTTEFDPPTLGFARIGATLFDSTGPVSLTVRILPFAEAVEQTLERVRVGRPQRDATLVELACRGSTPTEAHALCSTVLESYVELRTELQRAEATVTAKFLREQVTRVGQQLAEAEARLETYERENNVVALADRASEGVRQLSRAREQRDQLEAERSALAALVRKIEADERGSRKFRELASFPTFLENPAITELLTSLTELENRRSELAVRRSPLNADLAAVDDRIAGIERDLHQIVIAYEQALTAQVHSLDETLRRSQASLGVIPTQRITSARLERETKLLGDLHRLLETRLREAEVAQAVNLPNVRVVGTALFPSRPASPSYPKNLAAGAVLGHDREEVERRTGLPVLTLIPSLRRTGPLPQMPAIDGQPAASSFPLAGRSARRNGELAYVAVEAIRGLASDLSFASRELGLDRVSTVAVTSTGRGEGKTFTACNLGIVRGSAFVRTLLIDADLRGCGVARFFDLPTSSPGLSDVLANGAEPGGLIQEVQVEGAWLSVLPAGTPTLNAAGLLSSPEFRALLSRMSEEFDLVIVDTPPLSIFTDAAEIAATVDAVLLVVRGGVTDRESIEQTVERLRRAHAHLVGAVLNDVPFPRGSMSRYYYPHRGTEP